VGSTTKVELTTVADCQSSLHRLVISIDCKSLHSGYVMNTHYRQSKARCFLVLFSRVTFSNVDEFGADMSSPPSITPTCRLMSTLQFSFSAQWEMEGHLVCKNLASAIPKGFWNSYREPGPPGVISEK